MITAFGQGSDVFALLPHVEPPGPRPTTVISLTRICSYHLVLLTQWPLAMTRSPSAWHGEVMIVSRFLVLMVLMMVVAPELQKSSVLLLASALCTRLDYDYHSATVP
jgi:hypothetical protein